MLVATLFTAVLLGGVSAGRSGERQGLIYALSLRDSGSVVLLSQRDRRSLAPVGKALNLGRSAEPGNIRAFSPDRRDLALAGETLGGTEKTILTVVDLRQMRVRRRLSVPGRLERIFWLTRRRLLAFAARDPTSGDFKNVPLYVIDPVRNMLVRRTMVPPLNTYGLGTVRVLGLFAQHGRRTTRIARIDASGNVRTTETRIKGGAAVVRHEGVDYEVIREPGLQITADGSRAYVIGPGQPVAEVDLRTLIVSYHRVRPALPSIMKVETSSMPAIGLGDHLIALGGGTTTFPLTPGIAPRTRPFGLRLLDTRRWALTNIDPSVDSTPVATVNGVIAFRVGAAVGFNRVGARRFIARDPRLNPNGHAFACGRYFYFQSADSPRAPLGRQAMAFDAETGRKVGHTTPSREDVVWLDSPCSDPAESSQ